MVPSTGRSSAGTPSSASPWLLMALAAALFSIMNFVGHRLAVAEQVAWPWVAAARAMVGTVVGVSVARVRGREPFVRPTPIMWLRSVLGTIAMGCTFYALGRRELPLGDTTTLLNLTPIMLALLAPLVLKERSGRSVWGPLALSATGVVLIVRPSFLFGGEGAIPVTAAVPAGVALLASTFSAFAMMSLRWASRTERSTGTTPEAIVVHFSVFGAVTLTSLALLSGARAPRLVDLPWLLLAGLCGGLAQIAMTTAYARATAARVSGVGYVAVPFSALLGALALEEIPKPFTLVGMALVVLGGVLLTRGG